MNRFIAYRGTKFSVAALLLALGSNVWALTVNLTAQTIALGETQSPTDSGTSRGSTGPQKMPVVRASGTELSNLKSVSLAAGLLVADGNAVTLLQNGKHKGGTSPIAVPVSFQVGITAVVFSENFDSVTAPSLPAGWITAQTGSTPPALWATTATGADSAPNSAFTNGAAFGATNSLISPAIALPASTANAILSFRHAWNFEGSSLLYDGGVLELSTDGGTTLQ